MEEYYIPTSDSETEFTEKRSRFIGHVAHVTTEEAARDFIQSMKKRYHDARHNCWCYLIREEGVVRYSDDGEPQGTAGQPMLNVFVKENITDVVCVVTRYFGGILLGAGGLVRAYTRSAKDALDEAGISVVRRWTAFDVPCHRHGVWGGCYIKGIIAGGAGRGLHCPHHRHHCRDGTPRSDRNGGKAGSAFMRKEHGTQRNKENRDGAADPAAISGRGRRSHVPQLGVR